MTARRPVGVFDSGVGGLSVLREIRRELPKEDLIYVADSGFAPYGDRPVIYIEDRAFAIVRFLLSQSVKAVVVACNTVTGVAIERLRASFDVPIVAIEPAVKPAIGHTKSGVVGVLATTVTLESPNVVRLLATYGAGTRVVRQPCPGLVELVEEGNVSGPAARAAVERYVRPLVEQGADTIVLGCTHYVFLEPLIQDVAGAAVHVVNPAPAVARQLRRRLEVEGALSDQGGQVQFYTSGPVARAQVVLHQLCEDPPEARPLPVDR